MAIPSIDTELAAILSATYGEEVRGSIHNAIAKIYEIVCDSEASTNLCYRTLSAEERAELGNLSSKLIQPGIYNANDASYWSDTPENDAGSTGLITVRQFSPAYVFQEFMSLSGEAYYRVVKVSDFSVVTLRGNAVVYDTYGWYSATNSDFHAYTSSRVNSQFGKLISNLIEPGVYPGNKGWWSDSPVGAASGMIAVNQYTSNFVMQQFFDLTGTAYVRIVARLENEYDGETFEPGDVWTLQPGVSYDSNGWASLAGSAYRAINATIAAEEYDNKISNLLIDGHYSGFGTLWDDGPAGAASGMIEVGEYAKQWALQSYTDLRGDKWYRVVARIECTYNDIPFSPGDVWTEQIGIIYDENGWYRSAARGLGINASWITARRIAIIGDSISTFSGYIPEGYATYYPNSLTPDMASADMTWWGQVIHSSGASLSANLSFAGSGAAAFVSGNTSYPSMYNRLINHSLNDPDMVIICLGTNDANMHVQLGTYSVAQCAAMDLADLSESYFISAYVKGVRKIQTDYPNADIMLINGVGNLSSSTYRAYYDVVAEIAEYYDLTVFDCGNYVKVSGNHPGAKGMYQIAREILSYNERYGDGNIRFSDPNNDGNIVVEV